jgi:hypothetical protein
MHPIPASMRNVLLGIWTATAIAATAHAQIDDSIRGRASEDNYFIETPRGWEHPMTPWGEPDIQATLDMMQTAFIPLERCGSSYRFGEPPCDMSKKWVTDEEFEQAWERYRNSVDRSRQLAEEGDFGGAIQAGVLDPGIPQRMTNLIVDPTNGLLPALTPEAKQRALTMRSDWSLPGEDVTFDGPLDFDTWDRCVTRGMPSSMMHYYYNGGFKILQAPGYVIFELEMIHDVRIIPTENRPRISSEIKQWMGESRGHWEGNTLVVETTNYKEGPPMINLAVIGSPPGNRFPISEQMKTTERIVRLNDEWWLYEITTEDPVILTRPFTVRYPMRNDPSYWWPEYACHEDNTIVRNYTETNRYERANPTPEPEQEPVEVTAALADTLAGRWVGRPRIVTIDVDIELEFTRNPNGTINGKLIGTNLGEIDKMLRSFSIEDRVMRFEFPNFPDPWTFAGEVTDEGTIVGVARSSQGGVPVTFRRTRQR